MLIKTHVYVNTFNRISLRHFKTNIGTPQAEFDYFLLHLNSLTVWFRVTGWFFSNIIFILFGNIAVWVCGGLFLAYLDCCLVLNEVLPLSYQFWGSQGLIGNILPQSSGEFDAEGDPELEKPPGILWNFVFRSGQWLKIISISRNDPKWSNSSSGMRFHWSGEKCRSSGWLR